ncbi:MAG: uroporphyrinogen-III C-methyltransferase [Oscillospiraceae bacterium]|nr:uroporphyrinogen-III C-methyltransferase [Oscillospiraceae bacterium]
MGGMVWLVGAGPGDPGLFTLRGKEVLEQAEVVVYDALVGPGVLSMIPETARLIYAGKRSGNHTLVQEEINRILLEEAQKGYRVVRLKGGDPFLFGRGGEELELLREHGIPFEVVPGVTSALAVPAYNGIPVTHRDFCSSVHIITGHRRSDNTDDLDFDALVRGEGTLVFLMGVRALPDICTGLLEAGMPPDTPAAVLENGTTSRQRRVIATVSTLPEASARSSIQPPAVIVVGPVCALAEQFSWYEKRPLAGIRVLVTRPKELISGLSSMLRRQGAEVLEYPAISTELTEDRETLDAAIRKLEQGEFDWLVFTSPSGVRIFLEQMTERCDLRALAGVRLAAIGRGSEKELRKYGLKADFIPSVYDGRTLGAELAGLCHTGERILIPRAAAGNPELLDELSRGDHLMVTDLALYQTLHRAPRIMEETGFLQRENVDFAVFTSASTVRGFVESAHGIDLTGVRAVCIGRQTQREAVRFGMRTWVAAEATLESLVACVKQAASELGLCEH